MVKARNCTVHHNWVTGKLGCKSRTKKGKNVIKVLLEMYEQE